MNVFLGILKNTPLISHLIIFYVIFAGIKALKTHTIPLIRILILPLAILAWSLHILAAKITNASDVTLWCVLFVVGIGMGWYMIKILKVATNKRHSSIRVSGSPLTLIFSALVFSTKYFYGYLYTTHADAHENAFLVISDIATSGIISGIFFGRAVCYIYRYKKDEHVNF